MEQIKRVRSVFFNADENLSVKQRFDYFLEYFRNNQVLKKEDIQRIFEIEIKHIDYIIVHQDNYFIAIANKLSDQYVMLYELEKFVEEIYKISNKVLQRFVAFYITRLKPFDGVIKYFETLNLNNQGINLFINIYNPNQKILLNDLMNIFYQNKVYMYDPDGSVIMQNTHSFLFIDNYF